MSRGDKFDKFFREMMQDVQDQNSDGDKVQGPGNGEFDEYIQKILKNPQDKSDPGAEDLFEDFEGFFQHASQHFSPPVFRAPEYQNNVGRDNNSTITSMPMLPVVEHKLFLSPITQHGADVDINHPILTSIPPLPAPPYQAFQAPISHGAGKDMNPPILTSIPLPAPSSIPPLPAPPYQAFQAPIPHGAGKDMNHPILTSIPPLPAPPSSSISPLPAPPYQAFRAKIPRQGGAGVNLLDLLIYRKHQAEAEAEALEFEDSSSGANAEPPKKIRKLGENKHINRVYDTHDNPATGTVTQNLFTPEEEGVIAGQSGKSEDVITKTLRGQAIREIVSGNPGKSSNLFSVEEFVNIAQSCRSPAVFQNIVGVLTKIVNHQEPFENMLKDDNFKNGYFSTEEISLFCRAMGCRGRNVDDRIEALGILGSLTHKIETDDPKAGKWLRQKLKDDMADMGKISGYFTISKANPKDPKDFIVKVMKEFLESEVNLKLEMVEYINKSIEEELALKVPASSVSAPEPVKRLSIKLGPPPPFPGPYGSAGGGLGGRC